MPTPEEDVFHKAIPAYLAGPGARRLAYYRLAGETPGVVFLGGFRSDMQGTKAQALEAWARARGRAFVRFDYSGHGQSEGDFAALALSDWLADVQAVLTALTHGPQILVGSSMGGWLALLLARAEPERVAALVTLAAAPDFTERFFNDELTDAERRELMEKGRLLRASAYSPEPYVFTRRLIEDGRRHLVLTAPLFLPMPVRMLQGSADPDVPPQVAFELFNHAKGPDIQLTLIKNGDHRLSDPTSLRLLERLLDALCADLRGEVG